MDFIEVLITALPGFFIDAVTVLVTATPSMGGLSPLMVFTGFGFLLFMGWEYLDRG